MPSFAPPPVTRTDNGVPPVGTGPPVPPTDQEQFDATVDRDGKIVLQILAGVDNKDASTHSITAPGTGVAIVVLPGVHTYTVNATTAGRFEWICIIPCDGDAKGWAMTHPGYMAGYVTAS